MTTDGGHCAKDFHHLLGNVRGMSGGQVAVTDWEDDLSSIELIVTPSDGIYKGGQFFFTINPSKGDDPPRVFCKTRIYHPNIDTIEDDGEICLNLLEDGMWTSHMGLADAVQGILFLFYNPNLEDPLTCIFSPEMSQEEYEANVKVSLEGGEIDGYSFPMQRVVPITELEKKGENRKMETNELVEAANRTEETCVESEGVDGEKMCERNNIHNENAVVNRVIYTECNEENEVVNRVITQHNKENEVVNTSLNRLVTEHSKENEDVNRVEVACNFMMEDEGTPVDGYQVQTTGDTKVKNVHVMNNNTIVRYECDSPNSVSFLKGAGGKVDCGRFYLWWVKAIRMVQRTWSFFS